MYHMYKSILERGFKMGYGKGYKDGAIYACEEISKEFNRLGLPDLSEAMDKVLKDGLEGKDYSTTQEPKNGTNNV
jgi:hypothetical protein